GAGPAAAVVAPGGEPRPWVRIAAAPRGAPLHEAEAEPSGVGSGPTRPRDVLVQLIRVLVVGDIQVGPPVAVVVREQRAEAVTKVRRLESCLHTDLAELRVSVLV